MGADPNPVKAWKQSSSDRSGSRIDTSYSRKGYVYD
jgi:hypothetical protein